MTITLEQKQTKELLQNICKQVNYRSAGSDDDGHQSKDIDEALSKFFEESFILGRVCAVDTQSVVVRLRSDELMSRVMVGNIAAVKSPLNGQCSIGVVTKIVGEGAPDPEKASISGLYEQEQSSDIMRTATFESSADGELNKPLISSHASQSASALSDGFPYNSASAGVGRITMVLQLIGTYYARWGRRIHIFRRSLYAVPALNAECALLYGANLRLFMSALSAGSLFDNDLPLEAGVYTMDGSTRICLDGNKFLQRHALITGSTGSGKSWCVASLLEKAAQCRGTNIVLFDLHGEYKTLRGPAFRHFHIAGPDERQRTRKALRSSSSTISPASWPSSADALSSNPDLSAVVASGTDPAAAAALFQVADQSQSAVSTPLYLPYWFFNYEDLIAWFIGRTDYNAPLVTQVFSREVLKCKQQSAKLSGWPELEAGADALTSNTPVPYKLDDVIEALDALNKGTEKNENTGREKKGPYNGLLTRTINRIQNRRADKRCSFMFLEDSAEENDFGYLLKFCRALLTPAHSAQAGPCASTELSSEAASQTGAGTSSFDHALDDFSSQGPTTANAEQTASAAPAAAVSHPGIKIIDLSEVPAELLPMAVSQIARLIFEVQFWTESSERFPIALFCDEAHLYIPDERGGVAERPAFIFERIAKEGRKYGISLVAISQRPSELNRTIISQCSNFVAMHLTNLKDKEVVQAMMPESMAYLVRQLPILEPGEAVFVGDACLLPSRVKLDAPQHKPDSATVDIWSVWSQGCPRDQEKVIDRSVLALCRQSRFKL